MEIARQQHEQYVDAWLAERASPKTAPRMAELLIGALDAVGEHGRGVLGDITHEAICGRILANAQAMHPCLEIFRARMVTLADAKAALSAADVEELYAATRFIIVDLLRVLSHLTGGVLTARLYEKLSAVGAKPKKGR